MNLSFPGGSEKKKMGHRYATGHRYALFKDPGPTAPGQTARLSIRRRRIEFNPGTCTGHPAAPSAGEVHPRQATVRTMSWDDNQLKAIRAAFLSFREHRAFFKEEIARNHTIVELAMFEDVRREVDYVEQAAPGLLPPVDPKDSLFVSGTTGSRGHQANVLVTYLNRAIARLEAELAVEKAQPVIQRREFSFISDPSLRKIVERDYVEIQRAFVAECWKACVVLAGGAIEAMLVNVLTQDRAAATNASKTPKRDSSDPTRWGLSDLIAVAIELRKITAGAEKLSHSVREFRNLIHPTSELRSSLVAGQEEARIAIEVLHLVHRDLSP